MATEYDWTTRLNDQGRVEWIPPPRLEHGQPRVNPYHFIEDLRAYYNEGSSCCETVEDRDPPDHQNPAHPETGDHHCVGSRDGPAAMPITTEDWPDERTVAERSLRPAHEWAADYTDAELDALAHEFGSPDDWAQLRPG